MSRGCYEETDSVEFKLNTIIITVINLRFVSGCM